MINLEDFKNNNDNYLTHTHMLQQAIDCAAKAGEELVIPAGVYVTGTLYLRDGLTLKLEKNALILGSGDFNDYSDAVDLFTDAVDHLRGRSLIYAENVSKVKIYGEGIIDGRGAIYSVSHPNHEERPFLMRILRSSDIEIDGITLKDSAAWTLHMMDCDNISIRSVNIHSRVNGNNDGIDIDSCRNCIIDHCCINSGDDAVCLKSTIDKPCENIKVTNCAITTNWAGFKIGTESVGDFINIRFEDSFIYDCNGCAIKICPVDGANLDGLKISNIKLLNCTGPIFITSGERMRSYHGPNPRSCPGTIKNICIDHIEGVCIDAKGTTYKGEAWGNAKAAVCISGTDRSHIRNITLNDINLSMPGGIRQYSLSPIPQMGTQYPEFHCFGVLPACGMYVRNTDDLSYSDIHIQLREPDIRKMIVIE